MNHIIRYNVNYTSFRDTHILKDDMYINAVIKSHVLIHHPVIKQQSDREGKSQVTAALALNPVAGD